MSIQTILGTLTVRPVQLLFDVLCSLLTRMSRNKLLSLCSDNQKK